MAQATAEKRMTQKEKLRAVHDLLDMAVHIATANIRTPFPAEVKYDGRTLAVRISQLRQMAHRIIDPGTTLVSQAEVAELIALVEARK